MIFRVVSIQNSVFLKRFDTSEVNEHGTGCNLMSTYLYCSTQ